MGRKKFIDLTGKKFNELEVLECVGKRETSRNKYYWLCRCSCGEYLEVRGDSLVYGHTRSCGCLQKKSVFKHGFWNTEYDKGKMKFYKMWQSMKARCDNKSNKRYKNYGGRGIKYDPKWVDFLAFKEDMYFKYLYALKQKRMKNPSFERIDVDGDYNKENCSFIELFEQAENRTKTHHFEATSPNGELYNEKNVNRFCKEHNLNSSHVYKCLLGESKAHKGWTFKKVENNQQKGEKDNG